MDITFDCVSPLHLILQFLPSFTFLYNRSLVQNIKASFRLLIKPSKTNFCVSKLDIYWRTLQTTQLKDYRNRRMDIRKLQVAEHPLEYNWIQHLEIEGIWHMHVVNMQKLRLHVNEEFMTGLENGCSLIISHEHDRSWAGLQRKWGKITWKMSLMREFSLSKKSNQMDPKLKNKKIRKPHQWVNTLKRHCNSIKKTEVHVEDY